jgi:RNA polymerase sigma-70 factor (ECF subfamily)
MTTMTADLTARLAEDLDGAFPDMVRELSSGLYSGALRMLGDHHEAEEVAQDAFVRAYRALQGYPEQRIRELRLRGWVWTIAANLCRNRIRSRARRPTGSFHGVDPPERSDGPEAIAVSAESRGLLAAQLLELPWEMRTAVVLKHVVGLSYDEISDSLDRPPGTVRSDVSRGLARLRSALHREEER